MSAMIFYDWFLDARSDDGMLVRCFHGRQLWDGPQSKETIGDGPPDMQTCRAILIHKMGVPRDRIQGGYSMG